MNNANYFAVRECFDLTQFNTCTCTYMYNVIGSATTSSIEWPTLVVYYRHKHK